MRLFVGSLVVLSLLSATAAPAEGAGSVARKCSATAARFTPAVYILDGVLTDSLVMRRLDPKNVESIRVTCTTLAHRVFGVEPDRHLVMIMTKTPDWHALLSSTMQSIVLAQERYYEANGRFASRLEELVWFSPERPTDVRLRVSRGGARWSATGVYRGGGEPLTVSGERPAPVAGR